MTTDEEAGLVDEAGRRYWDDPLFHARVLIAVQLAERHQPLDGFDRWHRDSLTMGACLALHVAEAHPVTPAGLPADE